MCNDPCQVFGVQTIEDKTKISEIMNLLMDISSKTLEESIIEFKDKYYPVTNDDKIHFVFELFCAIRYRPLVIESFSIFVKSIFEQDPNELNTISQMILSFLFRVDFQNSAHMCFLYHLYKIDFIQIDSIFSYLEQFINSMGRSNELPLIVYSWFAKEIETNAKWITLFTKIQKIIQKLKDRNGLSESFERFIKQLDEMKNNDWELYTKYRNDGYNENIIYQLVKNDDVDGFQSIFNQAYKVDINQMIPDSIFDRVLFLKDGARPLHIAAYFGSIKIFKYLLLNEADFQLKDNASNNVTHFAVAGGNAEIIHILEHNEWDFHRAPFIATQFHRNDIYTYLFESKYLNNEKESNVLISASISNNVEAIIHCAGELEMDVNFTNKNNETPLFQSVMSRSLDALELLLHHKDINIKCVDKERANLLHVASRRNFYEGMKILLNLKNKENENVFILDVNEVDNYGSTPLTIAAELGHIEIVKLLLNHPDIKPNYALKNGSSLHLAVLQDNVEMIKVMLESNKFDPNLKNQSSFTPLHIAAYLNQPESIRVLCDCTKNYGVDVNCLDETGQSPLAMSIESGDVESVKAFLQSGREFDLDHKNSEKLNLIEIAQRNGNEEIIQMLDDYVKKH